MTWEEFFIWFVKALPGIGSAFFAGYQTGKWRKDEVEKKLIEARQELDFVYNQKVVKDRFNGMSSSDVIDSVTGGVSEDFKPPGNR